MAKKNNNKKNSNVSNNRNRGEIRTRTDRAGNIRTETYRRPDGSLNFAASTDPQNQRTTFYVDMPNGESYSFNGRAARTIFRILQKHYDETTRALP